MKSRKTAIYTFFLVLLSSCYLVSCGNGKDAAKDKTEKCKKINDKDLGTHLFAKDTIKPDHFYTKIGVDFKTSKEDRSFTSSVKLRTDSAFSGTIKQLGVIGATYLITVDSMIFVNKLEKCYFKEHLDYVSSLFGTEVEFDFFQDLILGLPLGLDPDVQYKQINSKENYILSSHKKGKFKKLEKDKIKAKDEGIFIQYHMDCQTLDLEKIRIQVPTDTTEIIINYKEKKEVDGFIVPELTTISIIHPRDSIQIELNYGTVKINQRKRVMINIPDSYNECP
ncbi:MAG: DUF4292 domain-containing protein [Flavobacteriales bacterium]|nr:DUF4292 domain-containing protein [Flavobacteriales bacterium]